VMWVCGCGSECGCAEISTTKD